MISIAGLGFRFRGSQAWALQDVNLNISAGEFVVVNGPSGCGKSTLALALGGYLFRQYDGQAKGKVAVAGMDVRRCPIYDVAEVVGLVQQNPEAQFCTLTVRDEVAFGLENRRLPREKIGERIAWALSVVGASHLLERSLATLSGGEKQKVAVAAVMAARPQVLILDEPTSNLDPTATAEVFEVIARIRAQAGLTVIVIEHKVDYMRSFEPRLVTLNKGHIVYDGPMAGADLGQIVPIRLTVHPPPIADREPVVRAEDVRVRYDGTPVLDGVSLHVHRGEFVAIMGDNGSGKTTFLQSLLGLLRPDAGRVVVLGQDTSHTPVSQLARQVGYVFQNPDHQLFAESVWQEASFAAHNFGALDKCTQLRIRSLLERCGLGDRTQDHPYRLSYGEKRRLNLVSVLSYAPRLILLDEVLIGQDVANAITILELLRERVERGNAVVMVHHNPNVAYYYATRLVFFHGGQVLVDAPTEDGFQQLASLGREAYLPSMGVHS